jgi:hypothetical protein
MESGIKRNRKVQAQSARLPAEALTKAEGTRDYASEQATGNKQQATHVLVAT